MHEGLRSGIVSWFLFQWRLLYYIYLIILSRIFIILEIISKIVIIYLPVGKVIVDRFIFLN